MQPCKVEFGHVVLYCNEPMNKEVDNVQIGDVVVDRVGVQGP